MCVSEHACRSQGRIQVLRGTKDAIAKRALKGRVSKHKVVASREARESVCDASRVKRPEFGALGLERTDKLERHGSFPEIEAFLPRVVHSFSRDFLTLYEIADASRSAVAYEDQHEIFLIGTLKRSPRRRKGGELLCSPSVLCGTLYDDIPTGTCLPQSTESSRAGSSCDFEIRVTREPVAHKA